MSSSYLMALAGGGLIGLAAALLWIGTGRVAGVSGIAGGLLGAPRADVAWRVLFIAGLVAGGALIARALPGSVAMTITRSPAVLLVAGVLVGFGTRLGNGCTSGHGVCGTARLSKRSIVATITFIGAGMVTTTLVRMIGGAS